MQRRSFLGAVVGGAVAGAFFGTSPALAHAAPPPAWFYGTFDGTVKWVVTRNQFYDDKGVPILSSDSLEMAALRVVVYPTFMEAELFNDTATRLCVTVSAIPLSPVRSPENTTLEIEPRAIWKLHTKGRWRGLKAKEHYFMDYTIDPA